MVKINTTMDLTRKNMIEYIMNVCFNDTMRHTITSLASDFKNEEELEMHFKNISFDFEFERFKEECLENFHFYQSKKKELEKLKTHELEDLGEKNKLWKLGEKQKKLIKNGNNR